MKAMSIIGLISSVIGSAMSLLIYIQCEKIKIQGDIKAGILDNLDIENWEKLVEFSGFAVQKSEQIQIFSLCSLVLFLFLLTQSIISLLQKR
jgi:hypothetical protein